MCVVCNTYEENTIKSAECQTLSGGKRMYCQTFRDGCIFRNPGMKVPYNMDSFLFLSRNEEDLSNLVRRV